MYANDLAITAQGETHSNVQNKLQNALNELDEFSRIDELNPNPSKTQVCAFHLKNGNSRCNLKLK